MIIKNLIDEDFINYKNVSMFIAFPTCSWKCDKEYGERVCQNGLLANSKSIEISVDELVLRYANNHISSAIVVGGLEPFDSFNELKNLLKSFREANITDDFVIYTGYYKSEINDMISYLSKYKNVIVKFGRFIPNQNKHYDEVLGIYLASNNQYAERIS